MHKTNHKIKRAFTLIELMSVVAIIIVVIGLMIPTVGSAMNKASIAECKSTLEKIGIAVRNYYSAFQEYPPTLSHDYLGKELFSETYGVVPPAVNFNPKNSIEIDFNTIKKRYHKDPWGNIFFYYFEGINKINLNLTKNTYKHDKNMIDSVYMNTSTSDQYPEFADFQKSYDNNNNSYNDNKEDIGSILFDNDKKLTRPFIIWSYGPDMIMNYQKKDEIGNWGRTRSKMM